MIVHLQRPEQGVGPWLLYSLDMRVVDFINPTPELSRMMNGRDAEFEAVPLEDGSGWNIKRRHRPRKAEPRITRQRQW